MKKIKLIAIITMASAFLSSASLYWSSQLIMSEIEDPRLDPNVPAGMQDLINNLHSANLSDDNPDPSSVNWYLAVYNVGNMYVDPTDSSKGLLSPTTDGLFLVDFSANIANNMNLGYYDSQTSFVIDEFRFQATRLDDVRLVLFGPEVGSDGVLPSAYSWIESATVQVNAPAIPNPDDTQVNFDFSYVAGSSGYWQAIPEPATALMLILGGMGAWIFRRSKLKAQQEEEA